MKTETPAKETFMDRAEAYINKKFEGTDPESATFAIAFAAGLIGSVAALFLMPAAVGLTVLGLGAGCSAYSYLAERADGRSVFSSIKDSLPAVLTPFYAAAIVCGAGAILLKKKIGDAKNPPAASAPEDAEGKLAAAINRLPGLSESFAQSREPESALQKAEHGNTPKFKG